MSETIEPVCRDMQRHVQTEVAQEADLPCGAEVLMTDTR